MSQTGRRISRSEAIPGSDTWAWRIASLRRAHIPALDIIVVLGMVLFLAAFAVRLYQVNEPPVGFHATRQYRSMIIARDMYFRSEPAIAADLAEVARVSAERQGVLEPPVTELLTASGYRLLGGEALWVPHVLASLFWIAGGGMLFALARDMAGRSASLLALAIYLFLPFGVVASRSFQPDPLMIMFMLGALLAVWRYFSAPSVSRLCVSGLASGAAIFIKPTSLFILAGAFAGLALHQYFESREVRRTEWGMYGAFCLIPAVGYYLYRVFASTDLQQQAEASFIPRLVLDPFFWKGWAANLHASVGLPLVMLAIAGLYVVPAGRARAVLLGLWAGYGAMCLTFSYHIATHDYYHLPLVPIAALSAGPAGAAVLDRAWRHRLRIAKPAVVAGIILVLAMTAVSVQSRLAVNPEDDRVRNAEAIGAIVGHTTKTVYLDEDYGHILEYHGMLSGLAWPLMSDLEWERLAGISSPAADERFAHEFADAGPDFFIVSTIRELDGQPDLKRFLASTYPVLAETVDYVIYDLR